MNTSRLKDFGAMLLIGDGMMGLMRPRRYTNEWKVGPPAGRSLMQFLNEQPNLTRVLGAMEGVSGVMLAMSGTDTMIENQRDSAG